MRLICSLFLVCSFQSYARLTWESKSIQLTAKPGQSSVSVDFICRNIGEGPVVINKMNTSCGCTTAQVPRKTIEPGESGLIKGQFDFGAREGIQRKRFEVFTSDGKKQTLYLTVDIPKLYTLSTRRLTWTSSSKAPNPQVCHLLNVSNNPINIQSATSSNPAFTTEIKELNPGLQYDLVITPADLSKPSRSIITITIEPAPGNQPKTYTLYAIVN